MATAGYSWARGKLIHEKNLKSKISCQTPFMDKEKERGRVKKRKKRFYE
jgi:hypothetical protein